MVHGAGAGDEHDLRLSLRDTRCMRRAAGLAVGPESSARLPGQSLLCQELVDALEGFTAVDLPEALSDDLEVHPKPVRRAVDVGERSPVLVQVAGSLLSEDNCLALQQAGEESARLDPVRLDGLPWIHGLGRIDADEADGLGSAPLRKDDCVSIDDTKHLPPLGVEQVGGQPAIGGQRKRAEGNVAAARAQRAQAVEPQSGSGHEEGQQDDCWGAPHVWLLRIERTLTILTRGAPEKHPTLNFGPRTRTLILNRSVIIVWDWGIVPGLPRNGGSAAVGSQRLPWVDRSKAGRQS